MTYLKRSSIFIILTCSLSLVYFLGAHFISLLVIAFSSLVLIISRKKKKLKIIEEKENGLIFSPISGVIKSIKEVDGQSYIHIRRDFLNEWGVYMPSCGKIEEVVEIEGRRNWFFSGLDNYTQFSRSVLSIKSKLGRYDMHIINSKLSNFDCWVDSGDYGFGAARLGYIKGSFNLVMVIPKDFSIVMRESEVLKSGKSIIAANTAVHS